MEKNRIKKDSTGDLKPIVITERDRILLGKISDYRILSTMQIYRLGFSSLGRARKRLYQLWRHKYLKRIAMPIRTGEGSSMYLYTLTAKVKSILIDGQGKDKNSLSNRLSAVFSEHALRINDFRACLELAAKESKETLMISWRQDKELKMVTSISGAGATKSVPVIPDAYFAIKHNVRHYHYFLEIDRGTADLKRIGLKCRAYQNLWNEKKAQNKFKIQTFRVLYVTAGHRRLNNMLDMLKKTKTLVHKSDLIMMTHFGEYFLAKPSKIFGPIWKTIDTEGNILETGLLPITSPKSSRQREENHHCAVQNPIPVNGSPGPGG
jgi:hypothetical protein